MLWKHLGGATWSRLAPNVRRGILRLYLAISVLWIIWFIFRIILVDSHYYGYRGERLFRDDAVALVSLPIGLIFLFIIAGWVLDGFDISKIAQHNSNTFDYKDQKEPSTSGINYLSLGRNLGEIFVKPNVWAPEFDSLTEYNISPAVAVLEMAFVRVAIIKRVVSELRPGTYGDQIRNGISSFVDDAYAGATTQEIITHDKSKSLLSAARSAIFRYEQRSESLIKLASEFADRLAIAENPTLKIVPILYSVYDEAKRLMRLSQSLELNTDLPRANSNGPVSS